MTADRRPHLYIDAGIAMTRAALVIDGRIMRIFEAPGRVAAKECMFAYRDAVVGKVTRVSRQLKGAFVDIGASVDAFLPIGRKTTPPTEGAFVAAIVKRPAIGEKGAVLTTNLRTVFGVSSKEIDEVLQAKRIGAVSRNNNGPIGIFREVETESVLSINVATPDAMKHIATVQQAHKATLITNLASFPDIHNAVEGALNRTQPLPGGGRLIVDETEGGCVIDVDSGAASEASVASPDRVNLQAAAALFEVIGSRGIGGRVIVDFIQPSKPAAKAVLQTAIERAVTARPDAKLGLLRNDGLFDMTLPKTAMSFTARAASDADWRLRHAMAKLEWRLRTHPKPHFTLALPDDLLEIYKNADALNVAYATAFPGRFDVEGTEKPGADIVEHA